MIKQFIILLFLGLYFTSFGEESVPLFTEISPKKSKIDFVNTIVETNETNYFSQDNIYNGAGVAIGDINNDGLADIFFVSNQGKNQLYLNKGKMKFKNISEKAFSGEDISGWKSGVTMFDANSDGWLDIYVCRYGLENTSPEERGNQLYINQGDNTFLEQAEQYHLNDIGRGMHASPIDFDQDGDLDLFVVNHKKNTSVMEQFNNLMKLEKGYSNRLLRNDGDYFTDITSRETGILSFGYCLGASVSDINNDGWPDIYVTNDYNLPDFLFINAKDGTFENQINNRIRHTSHYSMGVDIADFNNDGNMDICVLDMSNKDYKKSKTNMGGMSIDHFWDNVSRGYPYQYMYNSLQLNLGAGYFSEIAHLSGISSTDWSWAPLIADFDRDGLKDLFVTNGYFREVRDRDFNQILRNYIDSKPTSFNIDSLLAIIPQTKEVNYVFKNQDDLEFHNTSKDWGITKGTVSQGAAYGDLDNDGDLDLVINNLNEPATILQNNSSDNNYINIRLKGNEKNPFSVGARVEVTVNGTSYIQELYPSRGYASSTDYLLNFGLSDNHKIDQIIVYWNAKEKTSLNNVEVNQTLCIDYNKSEKEASGLYAQSYAYQKELFKVDADKYDDFKRELLIPHQMSQLGPFMSTNKDKSLLYIGGCKGMPGSFYRVVNDEFELIQTMDRKYEDGESVFFDVDGDGDEDLYIVSGGNEYPAFDTMYQDRLYLNVDDSLILSQNIIPKINASGQCVKECDFDNDGDMDLFVGGRQVPGLYPSHPESYWLKNENGIFSNEIESIAPELRFTGMICDVEFTDLNNDGLTDLLVVGEWMKIQTWINHDGVLALNNNLIHNGNLDKTDGLKGWWNSIQPIDIDNNGSTEYLVGNLGNNNKFHPNKFHELRIYLEDFDKDGTNDIVMSKQINGIEMPVRGKQCLSEQMPVISESFKTYEEFSNANFEEIFPDKKDYLSANNFASGILWPKEGEFYFTSFSNMGQMGPINEFIPIDVNGDGYQDFMAFGNRYEAEIETPRYDGNPGLIFINESGSGNFRIYPLEMNGNFSNMNTKDALKMGNLILISNAMQSINFIDLMNL